MKTKLPDVFAAMSLAALMFLTPASIRAGSITVVDLPATGTDAASGITNSNSYVCAFNYGNSAVGTVTNNGVPFTHFGWPGGNNNKWAITNAVDTNFGGQVVLTTGGPAANKLANVSSAGQGNLAGQADGNMYTLLTDLIYPGGVGAAGAWLQQEFDNLIPGDSYSLRIYYRYWGNTTGDRKQDVYFTGEGYKQAFSGNPLDIDAGGAHYIEYNFVAFTTNVFCIMSNDIAGGASMAEAATLEYDTNTYAPFIIPGHDASPSWLGGGIAQFSALALGTPSLSYQWYSNSANSYTGAAAVTDGNDYSGSTTPTLTATNNVLDYYFLIVTNDYGSVTSSIVQINPVPVITAQSAPTNVANTYVAFGVAATGFPPLSYQWYFNTVSNYSGATMTMDGNGYSGSTTANLQATTNLQDYYFVIVKNSYGSGTSSITAYNPYPVIVKQPAPSITGNTVGFNAAAGGWPTLGYQWYFNTVSNYAGASVLTDGGGVSGSTTTNVSVTSVSGYYDYYFVVASNYYGSVTSSIAQAVSALTVVAAGEPIWDQTSKTNVMITFSDMLDPVTAATPGNYSLTPAAAISSAAVVASNEVSLTTSPLAGSYTLTVANVKDYLGGTMSPSVTNIAVGVYPAKIALWVRADTGVIADSSSNVSEWDDMSGNGNNLYTISGIAPKLATNNYGDPVIRFTSAGTTNEMDAFPTATLAITNDISIVAVMNFVALGAVNGEIVSKTGSGAGHNNIPAPYDYNSGGTPGIVRGDGTHYGSSSSATAPSIGRPQILAVSESGNVVTHYLNGKPNGTSALSGSFAETSSVDQNQDLTIGTRTDFVNRLSGDMSELIIAGSAISSYDVTQLDNYLIAKHNIVFINTSPTNLVFSAAGGNLTLIWPADHTGWQLQAQTNSVSVGLSRNWFNVGGSTTTNQMVIPLNLTNGTVFYRLAYP